MSHTRSDIPARTGHIGRTVQAMRGGMSNPTGASYVLDDQILEVLAALKVLDPDHKQPLLEDIARIIADQRAQDRAAKAGLAWGRLSAMKTRIVR